MVETRRSSNNFVYTSLATPTRKSKALQKAIIMASELDTVTESIAANVDNVHIEIIQTDVPPADELDDVIDTDTMKADTIKAPNGKSSKRKRKDNDDDAIEFPKSFTVQMISETLKELRIVRKTPPPLIPLCRIMLNQADVVLLDFPTNEKPTMGHLVVPEWNLCSKQVIDDAFTIATLCVDDSGFVVCFCDIKQLKILDAAAKKRNLERQRMYFMVQKTPCEVTRDAFGVFESSCYYFIIYTRIGVDVGKINSVVYSMRELNQNNNVLFNVLAEKDRLPVHEAKQSRYGFEKSTKVMEFILHSFCVTGGFALDLFAGTGSMMEACALKGVHYFKTEKDEVLVQSVLALRRCGAPSINLDKSDESGDEDDIENVPVQDVDEPLD